MSSAPFDRSIEVKQDFLPVCHYKYSISHHLRWRISWSWNL